MSGSSTVVCFVFVGLFQNFLARPLMQKIFSGPSLYAPCIIIGCGDLRITAFYMTEMRVRFLLKHSLTARPQFLPDLLEMNPDRE